MQVATITIDNELRCVRIDGDTAVETGHRDVGELLRDTNWRTLIEAAHGPRHHSYRFAPVVPTPEKIICVGQNYADHIAEMGATPPDYPTLFPKFARTLTGANDEIVLPSESSKVDWEAELCIVIGAEVRRADEAAAAAAIAGYTIMNDVSMRDWQRNTSQFTAGKVWEATTPVGPVVTIVEPGAPSPDWKISCEIDGEMMQSSTTGQLVFDTIELVRYISTIITLAPGDLITTGTPGGVGAGRDPQIFLRPGQEMVTTIANIGQCRNTTA